MKNKVLLTVFLTLTVLVTVFCAVFVVSTVRNTVYGKAIPTVETKGYLFK